MPTYEYVCRECGQHLEVVQSFSDDPLETCERCGGPLRKVFSAAGIIFKGSGYYVTDTRAARSGSSGSSSGSGSSEGSSSSDSSSSSGDSGSSGSSGSSDSSTGAGSSSANGSGSA
jgi:putative FmdB family regulatory protein